MTPQDACPEPPSVDLLVDGELGEDERDRLEQHLERCPKCRGLRESLARSNELLRASTGAAPTPAEWASLVELARVELARRPAAWSWRLWAAAVLVAVAVPAGLWLALRHRHPDGAPCRCDLVAPSLDLGL